MRAGAARATASGVAERGRRLPAGRAVATQTVFGEGEPHARMLVGEAPGDREDVVGRLFVDPA